MGKEQYAQKVDPYVKAAIEGLTQQYISDNRIHEKGEMISLLYNDHLEREKERLIVNSISKGDVLSSYLKRIAELFLSSAREHDSIIEMLTSNHQEEIEFLEMKVKKLEGTVSELTRQLEEKTIEKKDAEVTIQKLKKKTLQ